MLQYSLWTEIYVPLPITNCAELESTVFFYSIDDGKRVCFY